LEVVCSTARPGRRVLSRPSKSRSSVTAPPAQGSQAFLGRSLPFRVAAGPHPRAVYAVRGQRSRPTIPSDLSGRRVSVSAEGATPHHRVPEVQPGAEAVATRPVPGRSPEDASTGRASHHCWKRGYRNPLGTHDETRPCTRPVFRRTRTPTPPPRGARRPPSPPRESLVPSSERGILSLSLRTLACWW